jgi:ribosomal protein S27AE
MGTFIGSGLYGMPSGQKAANTEAARDAREAQESVESVRRDVDRLLLITEALWTLLKKQNGYTDNDLIQLVNEIDLQDGVADGKPAKVPPRPCPQCGRMVAAHHTACAFCGQAVPEVLFGR